jgi:hypothetical protein
MSNLMLGATTVSMDEPCFGLSEVDLQSPKSRGFHRYQILTVVRGDRLAEMRRDLGVARKFKAVQQFRIPGGVVNEATGKGEILHTVGELIDIADFLRDGRIPEPEVESTLDMTAAYHDTMDMRRRRARKRTVHGPQKSRG